MLVGHQWMPVSAEHKKIVNRIGASMVNEVGASLVVTMDAIGASVVVMGVTMANRVWASVADWGTMAHRVGTSVSVIKRNSVNVIVIVVVVVVEEYEQSLLSAKSVERLQKIQ